MKTGRTKKRTKNSNRNFFQNDNLISVKPASMFGTPVQNDDKKAGQRMLIGQNKKENRHASSAVSYLSFALSHGKSQTSAYRPPGTAGRKTSAYRPPGTAGRS